MAPEQKSLLVQSFKDEGLKVGFILDPSSYYYNKDLLNKLGVVSAIKTDDKVLIKILECIHYPFFCLEHYGKFSHKCQVVFIFKRARGKSFNCFI